MLELDSEGGAARRSGELAACRWDHVGAVVSVPTLRASCQLLPVGLCWEKVGATLGSVSQAGRRAAVLRHLPDEPAIDRRAELAVLGGSLPQLGLGLCCR
ncbi:hypothetical protein MLD38_025916 [Melastoma candidum]|uniref:Uncharacterized protein n=1 Tax=Melastoma candidum TaxID=119954 RepID=A0ACB9NWL1_9MYRT|nr:hypothetical protein MLD38_025916 [Melastoma candidum]